MTYYVDLLEIKNIYDDQTITVNIRIENIIGQENLARITIWLVENQTKNPDTDAPLAMTRISNTTTGSLNLITNHLVKPNSTNCIELGGFASINAVGGSKIHFDLVVEQVTPQA